MTNDRSDAQAASDMGVDVAALRQAVDGKSYPLSNESCVRLLDLVDAKDRELGEARRVSAKRIELLDAAYAKCADAQHHLVKGFTDEALASVREALAALDGDV